MVAATLQRRSKGRAKVAVTMVRRGNVAGTSHCDRQLVTDLRPIINFGRSDILHNFVRVPFILEESDPLI